MAAFFLCVDENMKRNYPTYSFNPILGTDLINQVVYHEAGHAAAIHLYNKQKQLPPVYFEITIQHIEHNNVRYAVDSDLRRDHFVAMVEGGRLIHSLPIALIEGVLNNQDALRIAYEADMINLLVGPLAEAKYVALRDGESFNKNLINLESLHNYGGSSDIEKVYEYLESFVADTDLQAQLLNDLLKQAYQFIESPHYWRAIERLAAFIKANIANTIRCEDAITVLDKVSLLR